MIDDVSDFVAETLGGLYRAHLITRLYPEDEKVAQSLEALYRLAIAARAVLDARTNRLSRGEDSNYTNEWRQLYAAVGSCIILGILPMGEES